MSNPKPIESGSVFGNLLVLRDNGTIPRTNGKSGTVRFVLVRCVCGKEFETRAQLLVRGDSTSCGCMRGARVSDPIMKNHEPAWNSWRAMIERCENKNSRGYRWYGSRGVRVHPRWRNSFRLFLQDMGDRAPGMTIERVDHDGHYEPGNCIWISMSDQQKTRRKGNASTHNELRMIPDPNWNYSAYPKDPHPFRRMKT